MRTKILGVMNVTPIFSRPPPSRRNRLGAFNMAVTMAPADVAEHAQGPVFFVVGVEMHELDDV